MVARHERPLAITFLTMNVIVELVYWRRHNEIIDTNKSYFSLWMEIFCKRKVKKLQSGHFHKIRLGFQISG